MQVCSEQLGDWIAVRIGHTITRGVFPLTNVHILERRDEDVA